VFAVADLDAAQTNRFSFPSTVSLCFHRSCGFYVSLAGLNEVLDRGVKAAL